MSYKDYFEGTVAFSELKPKDRLRVLYEFIKAIGKEGISRKELEKKFPSLSSSQIYQRVYRDLYFGNLAYTFKGKIFLTDLGLKILEKGSLTLEDLKKAKAPDFLIKRITRKPRVIYYFIGVDDATRGKIYWISSLKKYRLVVKKEKPKIFEKLGIVVHGSIDTGGQRAHERLVVEAKTWTFVKEKNPEEISDIEEELADFLEEAVEVAFGGWASDLIIKEGASYLSEPKGEVYIVDYPEKGFFAEYKHYDKKTGRLKRSNTITFLESEMPEYERKKKLRYRQKTLGE